ncbi:MAG TPA: hypothetical protein VFT64_05485 [Rickettsiales bacterium]|nr:hypothetical protein [Rickettsiales bacterium]
MKKLALLTAACLLAASPAVMAQTENDQDVKSDVNAINKDNAALQKDRDRLAQHRQDKAMDKATDSYGSQAVDSTKIGADKAAIGEKEAEKSVDKKILKHHKKKMKRESDTSGNQ